MSIVRHLPKVFLCLELLCAVLALRFWFGGLPLFGNSFLSAYFSLGICGVQLPVLLALFLLYSRGADRQSPKAARCMAWTGILMFGNFLQWCLIWMAHQ